MAQEVVWNVPVLIPLHCCVHLFHTCSVDSSRVQGAVEGRDCSHFLCLQLSNCFLFHWWRGCCFRQGGREYVLAVLDASETHKRSSVRTQRKQRFLREKETSSLWSLTLWEISAGWWEYSKYKVMDCIGEIILNKQQSRTSYQRFWKINSLLRGLNNA